MRNYDLYNKVIESFGGDDEGVFNASARNWIESAEDVKFEDSDANELFFAAKQYCRLWRNKAINGRISKQRMIECVKKIAEKNLPNPYDPNEVEEIEEKVEDKVEETPVEEKTYVFGVVKEAAPATEENIVNKEPKEENAPKTDEEKRFFTKRRKR